MPRTSPPCQKRNDNVGPITRGGRTFNVSALDRSARSHRRGLEDQQSPGTQVVLETTLNSAPSCMLQQPRTAHRRARDLLPGENPAEELMQPAVAVERGRRLVPGELVGEVVGDVVAPDGGRRGRPAVSGEPGGEPAGILTVGDDRSLGQGAGRQREAEVNVIRSRGAVAPAGWPSDGHFRIAGAPRRI